MFDVFKRILPNLTSILLGLSDRILIGAEVGRTAFRRVIHPVVGLCALESGQSLQDLLSH